MTRFEVRAGAAPSVAWEAGGQAFEAAARLVVGADGRNSQVRKQLGIELHEDEPHHLFAGLLVEDVPDWPEEVQSMGTEGNVQYFVFPQGGGRHRLYLSYGYDQKGRFSGEGAAERFLQAFRLPSVPGSAAIAAGTIAGPCHSVPNQSTWVDSPVREGAVLIGDAAGFNDPIVGQGLSISLRDVRVVGELLLGSDDWRPALFAPYVEERAERMRRLRFAARLDAVIHAEFGPEAAARKLRFREARAEEPAARAGDGGGDGGAGAGAGGGVHGRGVGGADGGVSRGSCCEDWQVA
nr:FAD-dependent monooxygenase [Tepidiforma sp.]